MSEPPPRPDPEFQIRSLETLRVISEPLRLRIIEQLSDEPRTVKQLTAALDVTPTKLYYHMNLLELHGLIRITGTRLVSGIVEKQYQASAYQYRVDRALLAVAPPGEEPAYGIITAMLGMVGDQIREGLRAGQIDLEPGAPLTRRLVFGHTTGRLTAEQVEPFYQRLTELFREFDLLAGDTDASVPRYAMALTLYPVPEGRAQEEGDHVDRG